jgi:hypothetical protein
MRMYGWACVVLLTVATVIVSSCRKENEKVYRISGRLVASTSNPVPVSNYTIDFYQRGTPGIPFPAYSTSASASVTTDQNGFFSLDFRAGKSSFLFLNGYNSSPISLEGRANASYPYFSFANIHSPGDLGDVYLYKKIDTLVIALSTLNGVAAADSLSINFHTLNGFQQLKKKGITVNPGSTQAFIDTLHNVVFLNYNYEMKRYGNQVSVQQRGPSLQYGLNYDDYSLFLESGDEKKMVMTLPQR